MPVIRIQAVLAAALLLGAVACQKKRAATQEQSQNPTAAAPVQGEQRPSAMSNPAAPAPQPAPDLRIPAGTSISVRLNQSVDTASARAGDRFSASLAAPVVVDGETVLPLGAAATVRAVSARPSGRLKGRGYLTLTLASVERNGESYPVTCSSRSWSTRNHKKRNLFLIGGGSGFGALVGGIASGGAGALIGAGAGAAAGTVGAAVTGRKNVHVPAETKLDFKLRSPVVIRR